MAALELKLLGELAVIRDGERLALPASRKTRALLAYLALNRRTFRREQLCELLWEIPDDPRHSLRWSLSKLRRLVDDDTQQRIVADRVGVRFDPTGVEIDIVGLITLIDGDLERCSLQQLEEAATRYGGIPLEGLDLPNFHVFDAWCSAERESAICAQTRLLRALIRRLDHDPERALRHARTVVRLAPFDENAWAALVRSLVALRRGDQAEQQYQIGVRMLKEAGATLSGALDRAWRSKQDSASLGHTEMESQPSIPRPSPATALPPQPADRLIGRDVEFERISTALAQTIGRRRAVLLLVSGEPGIGKSCLLAAAAGRAREAGALLIDASAYESEAVRPFALWIDALRKLGPEPEAAIFGPGDHPSRDRLFGGLSDLIAARARVQPVVLMFDDLQWCDESSSAALHYVARTNADQPFLGILAAREDELRDNTPVQCMLRALRQLGLLEEIKLGPLGADALRELISTRSPQANSERLSKECGGNPLLAIELARAEAAGDSGHSIGELVQERLARFDSAGGEMLRWAAVLAPQIDATTLGRVTGLDWNTIGEALDTAARNAMLMATERGFRFSHDLIARSIYAAIPLARRRTMHRRIAELLEQDTALDPERAADLAHHASQSGDAALAARAMVSAGQLCLRFFANDQALSLARKGLQSVEQLAPAERVCLTLELREIMLAAAPLENWEAAAREYAALAEQALDHGALSHARRGYYMASYVRWMHGHWSGAREEILQSERVTRGGTDQEHIVGMAEAAKCLVMLERDLTHADAMLMEAQALAARKHVRHYAIAAARGMLRFHENQLDTAADLFEEARALARASGDRINEFEANEYLTMIEIERGRPQSARAHCAVLIELGEKLREGSELPFARALDALCEYTMADKSAPLAAALEDLRSADAKYRLAYILTRAALVDLERQRPQAAVERASEALACAEALDRATEIMLAHYALARALHALNDLVGYAKHAAALAELDGTSVAQWARDRAAGLTNAS